MLAMSIKTCSRFVVKLPLKQQKCYIHHNLSNSAVTAPRAAGTGFILWLSEMFVGHFVAICVKVPEIFQLATTSKDI